MDYSLLDRVDAQKGHWRDTAAEAKGIATRYYWIGRGKDALKVSYGMAGAKPNATTVREVWKQRHYILKGNKVLSLHPQRGVPRLLQVVGPDQIVQAAVEVEGGPVHTETVRRSHRVHATTRRGLF